jgi:hypothetical protein
MKTRRLLPQSKEPTQYDMAQEINRLNQGNAEQRDLAERAIRSNEWILNGGAQGNSFEEQILNELQQIKSRLSALES